MKYDKKISKQPDGCWIWTGAKFKHGYGRIRTTSVKFGENIKLAHRVIYEIYKGPIPEGLVLDHLCRNPSCVNPEHLDPCTQRENIRRAAIYWHKTECPSGHQYDDSNTYVNPLGRKICRKCTNAAGKRYREKMRGRRHEVQSFK